MEEKSQRSEGEIALVFLGSHEDELFVHMGGEVAVFLDGLVFVGFWAAVEYIAPTTDALGEEDIMVQDGGGAEFGEAAIFVDMIKDQGLVRGGGHNGGLHGGEGKV